MVIHPGDNFLPSGDFLDFEEMRKEEEDALAAANVDMTDQLPKNLKASDLYLIEKIGKINIKLNNYFDTEYLNLAFEKLMVNLVLFGRPDVERANQTTSIARRVRLLSLLQSMRLKCSPVSRRAHGRTKKTSTTC